MRNPPAPIFVTPDVIRGPERPEDWCDAALDSRLRGNDGTLWLDWGGH
ncbi:hypothetical protein [Hwanghaeella sp. LZ110]